MIYNTHFENNRASELNGGAIAIENLNYLEIGNSSFNNGYS